MGIAFHTVAGSAASGTAGATVAFTPGAGDSFAVRNFENPAMASLELLCAEYSTKNTLQVRSPSLHDIAKGIHVPVQSQAPVKLLPQSNVQALVAQDTLIVELVQAAALGASETEVAALGIYYSDLPGASARLHSPGDIAGNIKYITTVKVTVAQAAILGAWASATLTSVEDLFHANKDYAILGYMVDGACTAVAVHGDDTSNYKVGGPASTNFIDTRDYFWDESNLRGTPHIPVFNAANKNSTFVDIVGRETGANVNVTLVIAELVNTV